MLGSGFGFTGIAVADDSEEPITECTVIDESGSYVLDDDLLVDGDADQECLRVEASDVEIDGQNNTISTDVDDGIKVAAETSNILIENVEFNDLERGIDVRETEDLTIRDNVFTDGSGEAIDINFDVSNVTIEGNEVDSWDGGVIVDASPTSIDGLEIRDNTFEGMMRIISSPADETIDITSDNVEDAVIEDNEFIDSDQTSIVLEETENVQVRNNKHVGIESSSVIDVSGSTDVDISGETIDSEGNDEWRAIYITGSSTNVAVTDSVVTDLQGTAIEVGDSAEETHLIGNELTEVERGVVVEGEETTIEDTVVEETTATDGTQLPGLVFESEAGSVNTSNTTLDGTQLDGSFTDVSVNEFADALEDESDFEGLDEPLDPPEDGESTGVYFNLSSSSADGSGANLTLNYSSVDTDGIDESALRILQYDYETELWDIISDASDVDTDEETVSADVDGVGTVALYEVDAIPPDASFEVDPVPPATPGEGDEVTFNASAASSPNGEIDEYRWDVTGDGDTDETTPDPVTTHTYDEAGEYEVSLTVEDEAEETNETTSTLTVTEGPQNGSEEFPYLIEDVQDLQAMNEDVEGHYELVDDIDASETEEWNDGDGFEPVGAGDFTPGVTDPDTDGSFTGSLDGQGHTISDLMINRTDEDDVGLFGGAYEATVEDVHLEAVNVTGGESTGSLIGLGMNVTVHDSSVTGGHESTVESVDNRVGGMVGTADHNASAVAGETGSGESILTGVKTDVTVTSDGRYVGGIAGFLREGELRDSTARGTVTYFEDPGSQFGGAVGETSGSLIENVSTTTDVNVRIPDPPDEDHFSSAGSVGGVVGNAGQSDIVASNASGAVEGGSSVGGLVGNNGNITDSYATGDVTGGGDTGGLAGRASGTVENSYATGDVSGNGSIGGLAGSMTGSPTVTDTYSTGDVTATGSSNAGGLVGTVGNGELHQSKTNGSVVAEGSSVSLINAGGLAGSVGSNAQVIQSYATGDRVLVTNGTRVGGLAGEISDASETPPDINVKESYAAVTVETIDVDKTGGFVGNKVGGIERSYWDVPESGQESPGAGVDDQNATGLGELDDDSPAEEMTGEDAIDNMDGFDFEFVWKTTNSYPGLREEPAAEDPVAAFDTNPAFPATPGEDDEVTFDASTSSSPNGEIAEYRWDFTSDGSVDETTTDPVTTHTYDEAGEYEVTLTVEDDPGRTNESTSTLTVTEVRQDGSEEFPYLIEDVEDLQAMNEDLEGHYELVDDIDASATVDWNDGDGFEPIGDDDTPFTGSIDGQEHTISDLTISRSSDKVGLFGTAEESTIANLQLEDVDIDGSAYTGGLVGSNNGTVTESATTGSVEGSDYVGGLVGWNDGNVTESTTTGSAEGNEYIGGLVGWNDGTVTESSAEGPAEGVEVIGGLVGWNDGTVTESSAEGPIGGDFWIGGLAGYNGADLTESYAESSVEGDQVIGGLVGNNEGDVTQAYATGSVEGSDYVGGLVGWNQGDLSETYATEVVDGSSAEYVGGLVGWNDGGTVDEAYWDKGTTNQADAVGEGGATGVEGFGDTGDTEPAEEMTGEDAIDNMDGFDFENVWETTDAYPTFQSDRDDPEPQPDLSIVDVELSETDIDEDDEITITADIENTGDAPGEYTGDLEINETVEATETVTVDDGETEALEFRHTFDEPGEYEISVDGVEAGMVAVEEEEEESPSPSPSPSPDPEPEDPEPTVSVDTIDNETVATVTDAVANESVSIPVSNDTEEGDTTLTSLNVTPSVDTDFEATISSTGDHRAEVEEIPNAAEGLQYVEINTTLESDEVENATLEFELSNEELDARGVDLDDVTLYHYDDGEWVERETSTQFPGDTWEMAVIDDPEALFPGDTWEEADSPEDLFPGDTWQEAETVEDLFPGDTWEEAGVDDPEALFPGDTWDEAETAEDLFPGDTWEEADSPEDLFPGDTWQGPDSPEDLFPGDTWEDAGVDDPEALFPGDTWEEAETAADLFPGDTWQEAQTAEDLFPGDTWEEAGVDDPEALFPRDTLEEAETAEELFPGDTWTRSPSSTELQDTVTVRGETPYFSTFALVGEQPALEIVEHSVSATEVAPGEELTVEATVENTGGAAGEKDVALQVNDEIVETTPVTVKPGAEADVAFTLSLEETGEYDVRLDDVEAGTVMVEPEADDADDEDTVDEDADDDATDDTVDEDADDATDDTADDGIPGFGIVAALIAVVAAVTLSRRVHP